MRIVLKVGGSVLQHDGRAVWAEDLRNLVEDRHQVLVVHGAGPLINERLAQLQVPVVFQEGQRVTTPAVLKEVVQVMRGTANLLMVAQCQKVGVPAVGLSGADGGWFDACRDDSGLGLVGRVNSVRPGLIERIWAGGMIPMVAPLAMEQDTDTLLNLNGDWAASGIAQKIHADALVFYTDSGGVRWNGKDPTTIIPDLDVSGCEALIDRGIITHGMIPKVRAGIAALEGGVQNVWIGRWNDAKGSTCLRQETGTERKERWALG